MPRITRYLSKAKNQSVEKNKPTGKKKKKRKRRSNNLNGFPFLETSAKTVYPELSKPNSFFFLEVYNHLFNDVIPASLLRKVRTSTKKGRRKRKTEQKGGKRGGPFVCMHDVLPLMSPNYRKKKKKKVFFFLNKWLKMINLWKRNIKREMERRRAGSGLLVCCKLTTAVIEYLRTTQHWLHRPWSLRTW